MLESAKALPQRHSLFVDRLGILCVAVMLFLVLSGCVGMRGGSIPYDVEQFGAPDSPVLLTEEADYRIAPADTLRVNVFQVQELSGDYEVDLLGNIAMPLIGNVKAADLTTTELDELVTARLSEKYLQNPDVSIGLKASARRNVTVDGAVNQPGMYAINGPTTLLQAISMARGTSPDSNPRRVAIFRTIEGKRAAAAFDLHSIRNGEMQDPAIYAGDIVVVDGSRIRQAQQQILMSLPIIGMFNPLIF